MAIENLRILENNLLTGTSVTVTASTAVVTLPGTNAVSPNRRKVWRATGSSSETLTFDLGAAYDVSTVALISSNLGTTGTVSVLGNTADSWGSPAFTSSDFTPYDQAFTGTLLFYFPVKNYRYWRIVLEDPSNSAAVEVGVAWLGTWAKMERNFGFGWDLEQMDLSKVDYATDGTPYTDELSSYKLVTLSFSFLTEGWALGTLARTLQRVGIKRDIILALFPESDGSPTSERATNLYGRFLRLPIKNESYLRHGFTTTFRESL
jgi:hypothetical protein